MREMKMERMFNPDDQDWSRAGRLRRTVRLCPHCGQLPVWPCNACGDEHKPRREGEGTDRFRLGEEECSDWAA